MDVGTTALWMHIQKIEVLMNQEGRRWEAQNRHWKIEHPRTQVANHALPQRDAQVEFLPRYPCTKLLALRSRQITILPRNCDELDERTREDLFLEKMSIRSHDKWKHSSFTVTSPVEPVISQICRQQSSYPRPPGVQRDCGQSEMLKEPNVRAGV